MKRPSRRWKRMGLAFGLDHRTRFALARAATIPIPYPSFTELTVQRARTVNQSLRPYPQYLTMATADQGGEKSDAG
ncbi:MAG: hypothetical protein M3Z85_03800 [Acidobacteriota bacterium]|nr:hypothetical protein [Acidobacteriota bacterium]